MWNYFLWLVVRTTLFIYSHIYLNISSENLSYINKYLMHWNVRDIMYAWDIFYYWTDFVSTFMKSFCVHNEIDYLCFILFSVLTFTTCFEKKMSPCFNYNIHQLRNVTTKLKKLGTHPLSMQPDTDQIIQRPWIRWIDHADTIWL